MLDSDDDSEQQRIITSMLVGAVIGGAYGWLFLQDTTAGIVGGIAIGTLLAMLYPEKTARFWHGWTTLSISRQRNPSSRILQYYTATVAVLRRRN